MTDCSLGNFKLHHQKAKDQTKCVQYNFTRFNNLTNGVNCSKKPKHAIEAVFFACYVLVQWVSIEGVISWVCLLNCIYCRYHIFIHSLFIVLEGLVAWSIYCIYCTAVRGGK